MKVQIKYKYNAGDRFPYNAITTIEGNIVVRCSDISFDNAKEELIDHLKESIVKVPPFIPEPEEVEL